MVERSAFWDIVYKGQTDSYYLSWWADFETPTTFSTTSGALPPRPKSPRTYVNPRVDELIDLAP